ncbi:MAG: GDP-mannose 4,6-dehydratase [Candidatus Aenigmarchaeota archaeon]|nr:GDP-mannose 4,6-dehydratase [Candidatus Aenigmarchaeota archaeon]
MNYEGKNVLITGGLGAVGSNLAMKLNESKANVTILDNMLEGSGANMDNICEIKDNVKVIIGDIRNEKDVIKSIKDQEIIFNCAAQISHVASMENPYLDIDINLKGTLVLLETCRKMNDKVKIVYTGTRGQIGPLKKLPADETHIDNPTDIYGVNKLTAENYHLIYNKVYGIKSCSIRMVNTFGPRAQIDHPRHSIVNWLIGMAIRDQTITVYGDGKQKRDCNYMMDAVEAILMAGSSEKTNGKFYNLGSGNPLPFVEIVKKIIEVAGTGTWKSVPWPKERKNIEVGDSSLSYESIKNDLGWEPKTSLEDGLRKTINFYRR